MFLATGLDVPITMKNYIALSSNILIVINYNIIRQRALSLIARYRLRSRESFIDEFKKYRCLRDPKSTDRKSKNKKNYAYHELSSQFKKPKD